MKKAAILFTALSIIASPVASKETIDQQISDAYKQHRKNIFSQRPKKHSDNIEDNDLDRVIMETWLDDGPVTLVVMKDGPVSLYFGSGRVIQSAGASPAMRKARRQFIDESERVIFHTAKTLSDTLPEHGASFFYFITVNRQYKSGGSDEDLIRGKSWFSDLFRIGRDLITMMQQH
jgi:hypothetical protein